ncbi:MAG: hypothetical protein ACFB0Z_08640 [Candidatus Phaeomarinobacter sp.]|mgnify:CR=1 FL=1
MSAVAVTAPLPTATFEEPTHRFGRALDDRLPFSSAQAAAAAPLHTASIAPTDDAAAATDEDGFSFNDLLDIVNPLQHLPVVSTLYREFTGDEIRPESRVVGGGIFGGIIGAAASLVDIAVEELSGDTMGGHVMTALFGDDEATPTDAEDSIQVAAERSKDTPIPAAANALPVAPTARLERTAQPQAPIPNQDLPELQTLSPSAFEALLDSFGAPADRKADETLNDAGLAYARPPTPSGQIINEAL